MGNKISFVWQGVSEDSTYYDWDDGLRKAMEIIEKEHEVEYVEPWQDINGDVILYWEAPITYQSDSGDFYKNILFSDKRKALLFAGGQIRKEWMDAFDMIFVESEINEKECEELGLPWKRAFGVNTEIFKPMDLEVEHEAIIQATFADWKRHDLFAEAMGKDGLAVGRRQEHDLNGYKACEKNGVKIMEEQPREEVAKLINKSHCVLNTADYWGGGQRCTLEGMACGVEPIVMSDSPKNMEYVEESGCGLVVDPEVEQIREAVEIIKGRDKSKECREYIMSKWTPQHYANSILEWLSE